MANTDPYAPTPTNSPTPNAGYKNKEMDPNWESNQGYGPNALDQSLNYDEATQYHRSITGSDRLAGNLYNANSGAFGPISSNRYYAGAAQAANRGNDPVAQQQQAYIQMLQQQALGKGPSAAQSQLQSATDQNVASAMGMAASGRGPGAAGAGYQAANMGAAANQTAANQSAVIRAQEQQSAQQMLGGALGQLRAGNANEQQMRDSMVQHYMAQGATADQANRQAMIELEKMRTGTSIAQETAANNAYYGTNGNSTDFLNTATTWGQDAAKAGGAIATALA